MAEPVPSPGWDTGLISLDRAMEGKCAVSAAVAFVSQRGATLLATLLEHHPSIEEVHLVARGAPITDPDALLMLQSEVGVSVSVVIGAKAIAFHPKLWLLSGNNSLTVISGSGNLTEGGLSTNQEQFEVLELSDEKGIEAQWNRFHVLTQGAITLDEMVGSIAWREWGEQMKKREWLEREQKKLDRRLADSPAKDMTKAKNELTEDLWRIHDQTVDEKLPHPDGGTYNPSGFRLELEGHRGATDPVHIVGRLCRRQTKGFSVIQESDRWDLTVESLVVDPNKPYYELFKGPIRELSNERLRRQFPTWPGPPPLRR